MSTKEDVVVGLRRWARARADAHPELADLLEEAAKEIEHLRSLAGAVTQGSPFADIVGRKPFVEE